MGLEIAEFLICVEEDFDVRMDDNDSPFDDETDVTVAMMIDFIERKIREKETPELMADDFPRKVFEQTVATLVRYADVPPEEVSPEMQLRDLFADRKRWQGFWNDDSEEAGAVAEGLLCRIDTVKFKKEFCLNAICCILPLIIALTLLRYFFTLPVCFGVAGVYVFCVWRFFLPRIVHKERFAPPKDTTVAQIADAIVNCRRRFLGPDGSPLSRSAIESRVINILADTIGAKPEDIMFSDRLVQDLKMG